MSGAASGVQPERYFPENIPEELKAEKSWVLWRLEERDGKPTKVLYQINRKRASSTNPKTWTTFEDVADACRKDAYFDGIGFVFHEANPYCGADIDHTTEEQARWWINRFNSYTERSPSGNGFHIICKAQLPRGTNRAEGELYSSGRFFTMTGDVVRDAPIRDAQDAADEFYEFLRRGDEPPRERLSALAPELTDAEIVRLAENAKNGAEFKVVYGGGGLFKSRSERDLSLASRLAFWTQDEAQIERIMRGSGCVREKWDTHRSYLRDTIAKAIGSVSETYASAKKRVGVTHTERNKDEPIGDVITVSFNGRGGSQPPARFNLTDLGNAGRFVARHGGDIRYCYPWGRWIIWDDRRWRVDDTGEVHRRAKETVSSIYQEAAAVPDEETRKALAKHAMRSESENKIQAMINLAKSEVPIMPAELDAELWLLNCKNGTIDLRTGELREHQREDLITKLSPVEYNPSATAPTWSETLEQVLPKPAVRAFFKKLCGYAISGDVSEHILPVLYGTGANGKSTVLNALLEAAGEYGMQAAPDLLIAKRGGHPTEVADLFGMRVVASIEVEDGRRLAEALVKSLTGGDKVRARRMRQDFWEFDPTHTAFLCTNHKPEIRGTDSGIWRRIRLIPFTETIAPAEQDKKLPGKLRAEMPGILAWAVEGCLEWQRDGLQAPEEVRKATGQYRSEMDVIGAFLRDECEADPNYKAAFKDVYERYELWCEQGGERAETRRKFNARLKERGQFADRRSGPGGSYEWHGLRLLKKQNNGFAGKLKERSENDYDRVVFEPTQDNGQHNFSSSVTSVDSPGEELEAEDLDSLRDLFDADERGEE